MEIIHVVSGANCISFFLYMSKWQERFIGMKFQSFPSLTKFDLCFASVEAHLIRNELWHCELIQQRTWGIAQRVCNPCRIHHPDPMLGPDTICVTHDVSLYLFTCFSLNFIEEKCASEVQGSTVHVDSLSFISTHGIL